MTMPRPLSCRLTMTLQCLAAGLGIALGASAIPAAAQSATPALAYPVKPVRLLVPFAAGGGADIVMRPFVQKMIDHTGQTIVYENRGGAGGVLAGEIVARAAPDGYTLLLGAVSVMTVTPHLVKMPFDPLKDFAPITKTAEVASVLAARPGFAPRTLKDIVAYAKASPGKLIWGVTGIGAPGHLSMEKFRTEQAIDLTMVAYKGAGPGALALLGGEVDLMSANPGVFMQHIKSGKLRTIGTSSAQRMAILPDVPTYAELGFPGYVFVSWYGLVAPAGTPEPVIKKLHEVSVKILKEPDIIASFTRDGGTPGGNTPAAFAKDIREEYAEAERLLKRTKGKL